jgi:hypothetical protein
MTEKQRDEQQGKERPSWSSHRLLAMVSVHTSPLLDAAARCGPTVLLP